MHVICVGDHAFVYVKHVIQKYSKLFIGKLQETPILFSITIKVINLSLTITFEA